ncbi:3D-(3,5/4)-trihydroxycyclohexane-1,2-dione acylhydrolase (decyclizing) [Nocardia stercoris]|uniref:acetolactate synthase n=1 Tax=Nocardia stercoris TaxID=2483361 RepID=A0A3M2LHJ3_9NOCA|nr:3D-(3,5/4)-trihydroxycyclohexane-1,2-dione acylhydrolase (decyclizing) [Nocardia stercoris]RMI35485.1 3D-(3,5/4)-trihydroxycyclohexane-1,2-dione acylhydrolase (decyclizing) [Nocardia stercoris]
MNLTTAQALVGWLIAQRSETLDGREVPLFPAVFAIFGHGNVLGIGTALQERSDVLPVWRGNTEQGMALAAVGLAKAAHRRQVGVATASIGPGALNMVTAAAVAHADRLPLLLLPGDTFTGRAPDPVLQQLEYFGDGTATANDAFRAVSRYFDRITRPEQLLAALPQVARVLTDPAASGPVTLALPQDVQVETFDFPESLFEPIVHAPPRPRADVTELDTAAAAIRDSVRPLLIVGGGVRYSGAGESAAAFAGRYGLAVTETTAGRTLIPHSQHGYAGPLGITGSAGANVVAAEADLVLAVGTRLQDFTTASWTLFDPDVRFVTVNVARFDAVKHGAVAVVADAATAIADLDDRLADWPGADREWLARADLARADWDGRIDALRAADSGPPSYAQIVGVVNDLSGPGDYVLTAAGGLPGELAGGWRAIGGEPTMDIEYGFSCMGYELAGAWGAAMTHRAGIVTTLVGDGSYLMGGSELFSAAFAGHPFVAVVCDNDGYAVIDRLGRDQGAPPFNNMFTDCRTNHLLPPRVDFAAHARALGALVFPAADLAGLRAAYPQARAAAFAHRRPAVIVVPTRPGDWTDAGAWWEVGVPAHLEGYVTFVHGKSAQVRRVN